MRHEDFWGRGDCICGSWKVITDAAGRGGEWKTLA